MSETTGELISSGGNLHIYFVNTCMWQRRSFFLPRIKAVCVSRLIVPPNLSPICISTVLQVVLEIDVTNVVTAVAAVADFSKVFLSHEASQLSKMIELMQYGDQEICPQAGEVLGNLPELEVLLKSMVGWSASEQGSFDLAAEQSGLQKALERLQQDEGDTLLLAQVSIYGFSFVHEK